MTADIRTSREKLTGRVRAGFGWFRRYVYLEVEVERWTVDEPFRTRPSPPSRSWRRARIEDVHQLTIIGVLHD